METELTAMQQLEKLPEPFRSKAIKAANAQSLETRNLPAHSISSALAVSFLWNKTKEGAAYWGEVARTYILS